MANKSRRTRAAGTLVSVIGALCVITTAGLSAVFLNNEGITGPAHPGSSNTETSADGESGSNGSSSTGTSSLGYSGSDGIAAAQGNTSQGRSSGS